MSQGKSSTPNHKVKKSFAKPKEDWVRAYDTHESIISKEDFDLANSLLLKDLRISPGNETVYILSGIARCADCGMNMIRKSVPSGDKKYFYYICKNSKIKNSKEDGCMSGMKSTPPSINEKCTPHSISEKLLEESVLSAVQAHIGNILNLEQMLSFIDTLPLKQEEVQKIDRQLVKINEEINRYKELKTSLYESLVDGVIEESEYTELKASYSKKSEEAEKSALRLKDEIEKIISDKGEKNFWIESFKKHNNITALSRKAVVSLIDEVVVYEGNRIGIVFKYQYNYDSAINFVQSVSEIMPLIDIPPQQNSQNMPTQKMLLQELLSGSVEAMPIKAASIQADNLIAKGAV